MELESDYDRGIADIVCTNAQDVQDHGATPEYQVIGGAAPNLKKVGQEDVMLHPSLDYTAIQERSDLDNLTKDVVRQDAMQRALDRRAEEIGAKAPKKSKAS